MTTREVLTVLTLLLATGCGASSPTLPKPSDLFKVLRWKPGDDLARADAALTFTFEAGSREHAVGALSLSALDMQCAQLTAPQLARTFGDIASCVYGAHYDEPSIVKPLAPWQTLGQKPHA